ncbi:MULTISPECIES: RDD family protein [Thermoanaerobacter]|uniref:RDD family membrane protein YckC n=1 Tax=Thermoanaerobacter pentosaceus TaxID=694059 RepID=A0ABT9M2L9_9THEO|nr:MULTISPECIES: RDD family protein [Thermoanaerobacter]MDP9750372.1 putative RDD family membrane protein YckC [Thermoanaerobacter pentosaceus]
MTQYAGFWRRVVALIIDNIVLALAGAVLLFILAFVFGDTNSTALETTYEIIGLIGAWLYFTLLESSNIQATIGKRIMKIKVTDLNGEKISFGRANARYWSKILSTAVFFIGFIMAGFTSKKQALHDMIAGTLVIKD